MNTQPKARRNVGRIVLIVAGTIVAAVALAVTATGGTTLWADSTQRDDNGYVSTTAHDYRTASRAVTSDNFDVYSPIPEWVFGKIRVEATGNDPNKPIFVGIARTRDVSSYLAGVDHAVVTDLDLDPFKATYERHAGSVAPARPATRDFWAASSQGTGEQSLTWQTKSGDWSVVVMNADGSPNVAASVGAGAKFPHALWAGIGLTIVGLLVLVGAVAMIVAGIRRRPQGPPPVVARPVPSA